MKKLISAILVMILVFSVGIKVSSSQDLIVELQIGNSVMKVNGQEVLLDAPPFIKEDRTLVPLRAISEAFGAEVGWDSRERKVTVCLDDILIELWIGQPLAKINGVDTPIDPDNYLVVPLIVPPGRTMVPLRFIAEGLGLQVHWIADTRTIIISWPEAKIEQFYANRETVDKGDSIILFWNTNGGTCTAVSKPENSKWKGELSNSGSVVIDNLSQTTTFTLICTGKKNTVQKSLTVTVIPPAQILSFSVDKTEVLAEDSVTLTWSTSGGQCTAKSEPENSQWKGELSNSGSVLIENLTETTTFTLICTGKKNTVQKSLTVTVISPAQILSFSVDKTEILERDSVTLTWNTNGGTCTAVSKPENSQWKGELSNSGSVLIENLTQTTIFTLICKGKKNTVQKSLTVTVIPPAQIISFRADKTEILEGDSVTLSWSTSGGQCTAKSEPENSQWKGELSNSGSVLIENLTETTTFTLICTGKKNTEEKSITVTVKKKLKGKIIEVVHQKELQIRVIDYSSGSFEQEIIDFPGYEDFTSGVTDFYTDGRFIIATNYRKLINFGYYGLLDHFLGGKALIFIDTKRKIVRNLTAFDSPLTKHFQEMYPNTKIFLMPIEVSNISEGKVAFTLFVYPIRVAIAMFDCNTEEFTVLVNPEYYLNNPIRTLLLSPNADKLVFCRWIDFFQGARNEVWCIDLITKERKKIVPAQYYRWFFSGRWINNNQIVLNAGFGKDVDTAFALRRNPVKNYLYDFQNGELIQVGEEMEVREIRWFKDYSDSHYLTIATKDNGTAACFDGYLGKLIEGKIQLEIDIPKTFLPVVKQSSEFPELKGARHIAILSYQKIDNQEYFLGLCWVAQDEEDRYFRDRKFYYVLLSESKIEAITETSYVAFIGVSEGQP